jgi:hypothetical protein
VLEAVLFAEVFDADYGVAHLPEREERRIKIQNPKSNIQQSRINVQNPTFNTQQSKFKIRGPAA